VNKRKKEAERIRIENEKLTVLINKAKPSMGMDFKELENKFK